MADNPGIAVFVGTDRQTYFTRPGTIIPSYVTPVAGYHQEEFYDGSQVKAGQAPRKSSSVNVQPNSIKSSTGIMIPTSWYQNFWKNRLHVIPDKIDFGSIFSAKQGTFELYNAGTRLALDVKIATAISDLTSLGITMISGDTTPPVTIGLGQSLTYIFSVSTSGPATIDDGYTFTFSDGSTLTFSITAQHVVAIIYRPQEAFTEHWKWLTQIIRKLKNSEQRISVRDVARQELVHSYLYGDDLQNTKLFNLLYQYADNIVALPLWRDYTVLTADVTAGDLILNVEDTTGRQFREGENLIILNTSDDTYEVATIDTVATTQITLVSELNGSWPQNAEILPILLCYISPYTQTSWPVVAKKIDVVYSVIENVESPSEVGFEVYQGLPVYTDELYLSQPTFVRNVNHHLQTVDYQTGAVFNSTLSQYPSVSGQMILAEFSDRTSYVKLRDFLMARRGKTVPFWISTRESDFFVADTNLAPTNQIDTTITGFAEVFARGLRKHIEIVYQDGTVERRQITAVEVTANFEHLTLDSNITQDWSVANVKRASLLIKYRLDTDDISFAHQWYIDGEVILPIYEIEL